MFFTKKNSAFMIAGFCLLGLGYILLAQGPIYNPLSWSVAPVILVVTYCIIFPLSILIDDHGRKPNGDRQRKTGV